MAARKNEWVYDQLLGFLGSPLFQLPVITYMEARCIIFEPGTEDSQEYRGVHKEYKRLVESLLEGFMRDTDLTYDHIVKALQDLHTQEDLKDIFQVIFEQVLAMEDFEIFVRLMTQKNIELQQQALLLIIHRIGSVPDILQPGEQQTKSNKPGSEEDAVLLAVLEQSKREYEENVKKDVKEQKQMDAVLLTSKVEASKLEEERVREQEKMNQALSMLSLESSDVPPRKTSLRAGSKQSLSKPPFAASPVPSGRSISVSSPSTHSHSAQSLTKPPEKTSVPPVRTLSSSEAAANWLQSALSDSDNRGNAVSRAAAAMGDLSSSQIKERQEYLRAQRDKLLEMKKKERERQLQNAERDLPQRPTSARVAHKAIARAGDPVEAQKSANAEEDKKLAMRKAIAERLKAEVIGNK